MSYGQIAIMATAVTAITVLTVSVGAAEVGTFGVATPALGPAYAAGVAGILAAFGINDIFKEFVEPTKPEKY